MSVQRPDNGVRRYSSSRGTRAIQTMVEHAPATGGLALWMHHVDVDSDDALPAPVANDGNTIFYAPRFAALPFEEQIGWVAHATLHVAFRHVQRRAQLAAVIGDVDDTLYNACADALINSTLSHLTWLRLPANAVYLDELMQRAFDDEQNVETLLLQWDVERLYRAVDDRRPASRSSSRQSGDGRNARGNTTVPQQQPSGDQGRTRNDDSGRPNTETAPERHTEAAQDEHSNSEDGPRSAAVRALAAMSDRDLLPGAAGERPEEIADATRNWAERLSRGHAADGSFSMLRCISADVPRTRTPWTQVLRRSLSRGLIREPELSWSRPARSWLANRGRTRGGKRMPWEPGMVTSKSVPRLALILDISGSIDDAMLARFAAQLDAITRQLAAQIIVIAGDDQVRHEALHEPGRSALQSLPALAADGGTDFSPLLEAAAEHRPDYAVVLTDLQGPAGTAPAFPVLWAVPPAFAFVTPPFGQLLALTD
ncbi:MAG: VWA-like domain-containing protein [Pseudomonadota bacterium]